MSFRDIEDNWLHQQGSSQTRTEEERQRLHPSQSIDFEAFNTLAKHLTEMESFTNSILASVRYNSTSGQARFHPSTLSTAEANARESQSLQSLLLQAGDCARETNRLFDAFVSGSSQVRMQRQVAKLRKDYKRQRLALEEAMQLALEKERKRQERELKVVEEEREKERALEKELVTAAVSVHAEDLLAREQEIRKLHVTAAQVGGLFKELAGMVDEQQENVERIDVAVTRAHEQTDRGLEQLDKATRRMRMVNKRTLYCFLFLLVAAVTAIALLARKH